MTRQDERAFKKQRKRLKKVIPLFFRWEQKGIDWRSIALLNGFTPEQVQQTEDFLVEYSMQKLKKDGVIING